MKSKLKGAVLQYALLISVLIIFLILSFILLSHTQLIFKKKSQSLLSTITQVNNAFNGNLDLNPGVLITSDSLTIEQEFLGAYQKVTVTGKHGNSVIKRVALHGATTSKDKQALYLADKNQPLVLVGDTRIKGGVHIPSSGVKAGSISGTYYSRDILVDSPINYSNTSLPKLEDGLKKYAADILDSDFVPLNSTQLLDERNHSFLSDTQYVFSNNALEITQNLTGNIQVRSSKEITIRRDSQLEDVLIVAPIVRINDGFEGAIHVVAKDSIIVGKNVQLNYPSSLLLLETDTDDPLRQKAIVIDENSIVEGVIIYLKKEDPEKKYANISISEKALVYGDVYCEGYLEFDGAVEGTIYTEHFLARASGGVYINHIFGGQIRGDRKNQAFCGLPLPNNKKGVVQWLY